MKLMSGDEVIRLAWPSEQIIALAHEKLLPVVGILVDYDAIANGVRKGTLQAREIQKDGKPEYVFFYFVNAEGYLNVNCSAFVGEGRPDSWLWCMGADMIAREQRARGIICVTARKGHVEQCSRVGYRIAGVELVKDF